MQVLFNCACTPCFNIIETVFCDMKYHIRKMNKTTSRELVEEARSFLNRIDNVYMLKKITACCKFFIKALHNEEF